MLIDWFTVVAQAVNFLILVWLLKRFLFKPILHAIDEREKGIATQLADAEAKKAEAQKEQDDFRQKNTSFDEARAAILKKATDEANSERQRLLDEARNDVDSLRLKRQDALQNEQQKLNQEISRWVRDEVFAIARKTLADLASSSLEERMTEVFIQRLRALAGPAKQQLAAALMASSQPARIRSAFDLPSAQRTAIESAIKETFEAQTSIRFDQASAVVGGIELSANGQKVAWSIAEYLATLEKSAGELLQKSTKPDSKPIAKSNGHQEAKPDAKVPDSEALAKPKPNAAAVAGLKREPKHWLKAASSVPKADQ
jgi:F-type H+-transporting ATPase subunit b